MLRTPRQAMTAVILLLALPACVTPFANKPAAPAPVVAMAAPEAPAIAQPEAPRPAPPEPALDAETRAIIETAIAALAPAEQAMPEPPVPEPPVIEPPVIESTLIEVAPEPDIDDDPGQLIGLAGPDLTELLGEPGFRREDADAQIWQYGGGDCALDIYLYRGGEAMPHRVTYYEFRGGGGGRPCLRALLLALLLAQAN